MKFWRSFIIIISLAAVGLLFSAGYFDWTPWHVFHPAVFRQEVIQSNYQPPAILSILGMLFTFYVTGILFLFLVPDRILWMSRFVEKKPVELFRLIVIGFLSLLVMMTLILSSALSVGTIFLSVILFMANFFCALLGITAMSFAFGDRLLKKAGWGHISPLIKYLIGLILIYTTVNLPYVGIVFLVIFVSIGLGVTIDSRFGSGRSWSLNLLEKDEEE